MNRNEEYTAWQREIEEASIPSGPAVLQAAAARLRRRQWVIRPICSLAMAFALFAALVNLSSPVAYACSQVPVLKELAHAVMFSPSLTAAVENNYVQPVEQSQSKNGITVTVEYLIVDAKQINLFYRLDSDIYPELYAQPDITDETGSSLPVSYYTTGSLWDERGVLRQVTLDFMDGDVPETLVLSLCAAGEAERESQDAVTLDDGWEETVPQETTDFSFSLSIDPAYSASGQTITLNQTLELDGQTITLTDCEIYPTHLRLNLSADEANTAWLTDLDFYIEGDNGQVFSTIGNGVSATGSGDSPMMDSYRAESPWFYASEHLTLVITGARWLEKDMESLTLDLTRGTLTPCPETIALESVIKTESGWEFTLTSSADSTNWSILSDIQSPEGQSLDRFGWTDILPDESDPDALWICAQTYQLPDYSYDQVILQPSATGTWTADTPVVISVR